MVFFNWEVTQQKHCIFLKDTEQKKTKMNGGWVIVYMPGADIYQMVTGPTGATKLPTKTTKLLRGAFQTVLTCAQVYWWLRKNG